VHSLVDELKCRSHLHRIGSQKSHNCGSVMFSAFSMPRECRDWGWLGVFFVVMFTHAGHFRYKKIIPQQVQGKKK